MITVSVWHNVARDAEGRHAAMLDGYQPGHPMVRVFAYQADPGGRSLEAVAEEAFAICNGQPPRRRRRGAVPPLLRTRAAVAVGRRHVVVGEVPLAVGRGWSLVRGGLNETRTDEHGTRPLPAPTARPAPVRFPREGAPR